MSCANKRMMGGKKMMGKMMGGDGGASGYGNALYGGLNPVAGANNVIQMNAGAAACKMGGSKRRTNKRKGGSTLVDVAVPALLFAANSAYRSRRNRRTNTRRNQKGSRRH